LWKITSKSGLADYASSVTVDEGLNYRTVTVDASKGMKTMFMNKGVDELTCLPGPWQQNGPARSKFSDGAG
jgi:hypothetical protein